MLPINQFAMYWLCSIQRESMACKSVHASNVAALSAQKLKAQTCISLAMFGFCPPAMYESFTFLNAKLAS